MHEKDLLVYVLECFRKKTEEEDGFEHEEIKFTKEESRNLFPAPEELSLVLDKLKNKLKITDGPERRNIFTDYRLDDDGAITIFDVTTDRINLGIDKINGFKSSGGVKKTLPIIALPLGTKWNNIVIKWLNGNDVEITLNNNVEFKEIKDFKELGFYNNKTKGPNMNWQILTSAANYEGRFGWGNLGGTTNSESVKKIDAFQKRVSELRRQLKTIFKIGGDPFETYGNEKEYLIKLNLTPNNIGSTRNDYGWSDLIPEEDSLNYDEISKKNYLDNINEDDENDDN